MKERTRGKKGRSNKKGKLVAYRKREEFLKMVLSLYIYIYVQNIVLSLSDYTTTKYSGMVRYVALCWRGMLSQPYMNPMGSFVVDWLKLP